MDMQAKINSGEIKIADQHAAYERSKLELKQLRDEERHRREWKQHQSPAMSLILTKYGQAVKASKESLPFANFLSRHPVVKQDSTNSDVETGDDINEDATIERDRNENDNENLVNQIVKYTEFTTLFLWEIQSATVGQISGNLSVCQNNTLNIYKNSLGVYEKYKLIELDEAGNSTYSILYSVD